VEPSRRASEHEQDMSWGGNCNPSDLDVSPEYYPQVLHISFIDKVAQFNHHEGVV